MVIDALYIRKLYISIKLNYLITLATRLSRKRSKILVYIVHISSSYPFSVVTLVSDMQNRFPVLPKLFGVVIRTKNTDNKYVNDDLKMPTCVNCIF